LKEKNNIEKFEELLQQEVSKQQITPPADVWSGIAAQTGSASSSLVSQAINYAANLSTSVKVTALAGVLLTTGVLVFNRLNKEPQPSNKQPTIVSTAPSETKKQSLVNQEVKKEEVVKNETERGKISQDLNLTEGPASEELATKGMISSEQPELDPSPVVEDDVPQKKSEKKTESSATPSIDIILPKKAIYCVGESLNISNSANATGEWLINGKSYKNRKNIVITLEKAGKQTVEFMQASKTIATAHFSVQDFDAQIIQKQSSNKVYELSLDNPMLAANWFINNQQIGTNTPSVKHLINQPGEYLIKAKITNNACATEEITSTLTVQSNGNIEFFDFFSPNGDGKNDQYMVNISGYESFAIQIVDLSNRLVFESQNPAVGWNGKLLNVGELCADGEYIAKIRYQLQGEEKKTKTLRITLIRN
jgi:gliding motility-associated-like protein